MPLKVGDRVRIRKDLSVDLECESGVISSMLKYAGMDATITEVRGCFYSLDIDDDEHSWDLELFKKPLTFHISWLESAIEKMKEQNVLSAISGDTTVQQLIEKYLADDLNQVVNLD